MSPADPNSAALSARFDRLNEAAGDLVLILEGNGTILHASRRATLTVRAETALEGMSLFTFVAASDRGTLASTMAEALATQSQRTLDIQFATGGGNQWFELQISGYFSAHDKGGLLLIGRNISAQWSTKERLLYMATHDELTGLPKRGLLSDRLHMAMAQSVRTGIGFTVLALDLDGFKKVNDALGHPVGDSLLSEAAARLRGTLRDVDTLARVGGDEFMAVLPGAHKEPEIQAIARRMISAIQLPFEINGHMLYVSTSIGAAVYPQHGDTEVRLIAHADTAMYRAKETGKARCVIYDRAVFSQPEHDVSMEAAMFDGVRNGEFVLHYQPIVDSASRQIQGYEALMRWMHPERGLVPPGQFIQMAEDNGLINLLGAWALKAACVQIRQMEKAAGRRLYVSVNVSPRQFRNEQFVSAMDEALQLSGLEGDQLLLEITEGILMSDPEHAQALLTEIASRGVRIAIDDFGTGYSSLAYLKRFPISTLKIDRAFIKELPDSAKDAAICNVVLSLASHLSLTTVAEGVENQHQLDFLASQGCDLIQGYFTGRPIVFAEALKLLRTEAEMAP